MKEDTIWGLFVILVGFFTIGLPLVGLYLFEPIDMYEKYDERVEIWDAKCPFGHYWTHVSGDGNFLYFEFDSALTESYTIKYEKNGELKTLILDSQSQYTHIILEDNSTEMYMDVYDVMLKTRWGHDQRHYTNVDEKTVDRHSYYIHVPDPKVMNLDDLNATTYL